MRPALLVDVDVDIYTSTYQVPALKFSAHHYVLPPRTTVYHCDDHTSHALPLTYQALEWMLRSNLIRPGTYVRYDDWPRRLALSGPAKGTDNYGQVRR